MAKAPRQPASTARTLSWTPGTGATLDRPAQTSLAAQAQTPGPPFTAIGTDAVPFALAARASVTITFPNLPVRNTAVNPLDSLAASQQPYSIQVQDHLLFTAHAQGESAFVSVVPQALDRRNDAIPGPFLGGGNTFTAFQVIVTAGADPATGTVVGRLELATG